MAAKNHKVDTDVWVTQSDLALELGIDIQVISNWVRRKNIKSQKIFGKTLVDKTSINVREYNQK